MKAYVATPSGDYPKDKVLLFLPDAFGLELNNNKLLADDFARNGIYTVLPDIFEGDPAPEDAFSGTSTFKIHEWAPKHVQGQARTVVDKVVAGLKAEGITRFGAIGYCFGGRLVFDLSFEDIVHASVACHPSMLKNPEDLEKYLQTSHSPLLINCCPVDQQFGPEFAASADAILGDGKYKPGFKQVNWEGCSHGFSVRGDLSIPEVKAGKEGSFKNSVEWLVKYL